MNEEYQAIYMVNGLIYVAEKAGIQQQGGGVAIVRPMAFMPRGDGKMALMEAFPFSDINSSFYLEKGTYITVTPLADEGIKKQYLEAVKAVRGRQSGLVLP